MVTHYRNCKRLREFKEIEISVQSCRGDSEEGKLLRLLSGFRLRIRPLGFWQRFEQVIAEFIKGGPAAVWRPHQDSIFGRVCCAGAAADPAK